MVAQSNSRGGMIVVGIDDKTGRINPLSFQEVQETTNLLGSLASEGVVPQILLDIENVQMDGGVIVVATIKQGKNKPYRDGKGIVWVKQGADKRKVFDNTELVAMLMENGQMHPDRTLNEFVVTVERKDVDANDRDNDRDNDREDRDKTLENSKLDNPSVLKTDREDRDNDRDKHAELKHATYKTLNGTQKNIIQFCSIPRSAREILDHIGYAYNSTNIANQIKPLLELGFIEMTEPDKPNSKNQKYRKVRN